MSRPILRALVAASLLSFGVSACHRASEPAATGKPGGAARASVCQANAKPANLNFTLKDVQGRNTSLTTYKGKVLLVDFWATWCGPCKLEVPGFVELYDKYKPQGFEMVGLLWQDEVANVPAFAEKFKMNYPILDGNEHQDIEDAYGPLWGLPTSFLISKDGLICRTHVGFSPKEQFEREIQALLAL
jgi:thiol-disulfide isomerase/thioredoxin